MGYKVQHASLLQFTQAVAVGGSSCGTLKEATSNSPRLRVLAEDLERSAIQQMSALSLLCKLGSPRLCKRLRKVRRSRQGVVVCMHACHPRTGEAWVGTLGVGGKPGLHGETQTQKPNKAEQR